MPRILIANREKIAVRVLQACLDAGDQSVAVHAEPELDSLHVQMADVSAVLDGQVTGKTYLRIDKVLDAADRAGTDAPHAAHGFRSKDESLPPEMLIRSGHGRCRE